MNVVSSPAFLVGRGSAQADLNPSDFGEILSEALAEVPAGAAVLAIVADKTRDDNTDVLFPLAAQILGDRKAKKLDVLIAQGTHSPMSDADKRAKIGGETSIPRLGQLFDHDWESPEKLITIGELDSRSLTKITNGLMKEPIALKVNRLLTPGLYNTILVFGTTMPHEVAGFSGGAKYFFPGVAGAELTNASHWLGALAGIENIIGHVETPTRQMFEAAADFVPAQVICLTSVVTRDHGRLRTHALFCGDFRKSVRAGAKVSGQVHIKYTGRKYRRVIALLDEHLNDMWVGGKASYRLGPVIEEGGELIIYAPHLKSLSDVHGKLIQKYGYAPLERVREMVAASEELRQHLGVAAHLSHVAFAGRRTSDGKIVPRYAITLSSQLPEDVCRQVNLGYLDPGKFRRENYEGDPDTMIVENAGRDLYLVEPRSTA
jgi:nickel-dependent lactate racemase